MDVNEKAYVLSPLLHQAIDAEVGQDERMPLDVKLVELPVHRTQGMSRDVECG